jgi:hypothetical protein
MTYPEQAHCKHFHISCALIRTEMIASTSQRQYTLGLIGSDNFILIRAYRNACLSFEFSGEKILSKMTPPTSVTKWVCEKITQNVAQTIFCPK